jgi:hypothetical protein
MNEIAFRRRLQHHKNKNIYVISIPGPVAELLKTDEIAIVVAGDTVKLQPIHYNVRGANV